MTGTDLALSAAHPAEAPQPSSKSQVNVATALPQVLHQHVHSQDAHDRVAREIASRMSQQPVLRVAVHDRFLWSHNSQER